MLDSVPQLGVGGYGGVGLPVAGHLVDVVSADWDATGPLGVLRFAGGRRRAVPSLGSSNVAWAVACSCLRQSGTQQSCRAHETRPRRLEHVGMRPVAAPPASSNILGTAVARTYAPAAAPTTNTPPHGGGE